MNIAPALLHAYPTLNEAQRAIVSHSDGPLLIIAGPGSGKTFRYHLMLSLWVEDEDINA